MTLNTIIGTGEP